MEHITSGRQAFIEVLCKYLFCIYIITHKYIFDINRWNFFYGYEKTVLKSLYFCKIKILHCVRFEKCKN